ncbi:MAG: hypothetical protein ACOCV2_04050 [Persicimonas sp.]
MILLCATSLSIACHPDSSDSNGTVEDDTDGNAEDDADRGDTGSNSDGDTDGIEEEKTSICTEEPSDVPFDRPPPDHEEYRALFDILPDELPPGKDSREGTIYYPSPSMHPTQERREAWLEEDQKAIFRVGYVAYGDGIGEGRVRIQVLVNFEPVPFGLVEAEHPEDSALPSDEEMRQLEERSRIHHYERREGEKFGAGIVVDPEHFEEGMANEVRILYVESDVEEPEGFDSRYAKPEVNATGGIVYFEGETPMSFDCIEEPTWETPTILRREFLLTDPGTFVESRDDPPDYIGDWEPTDGHPGYDLREVTEVDRETTRARTWVAGESSFPYLTYYAVNYDYLSGEIEPVGLLENLPSTEPWLDRDGDYSDDLAVRLDRDIDLEPGAESATFMLLFEGWFHREEAASDSLPNFGGFKQSNTLWLQREEE